MICQTLEDLSAVHGSEVFNAERTASPVVWGAKTDPEISVLFPTHPLLLSEVAGGRTGRNYISSK
jgi:hypothetical protein